MKLLRGDLLRGCSIALVDGAAGLRWLLESLGALVLDVAARELGEDGVAEEWARERGPLDALVCDIGFTAGDDGSRLEALDRAWPVIQGVAAGSLIPSGPPGGGATRKVVLLGPPAGDGGSVDSEPARAALENLARTLSIEWARYSIVATMIAPGAGTTADEVATLVAFLCSKAGHYYSGCRFSLGAVTDPR
jgi:NAD(P)-dependent dehydrogenase (short-subunit alcohol dehydrogenase family)